MRKAPLRSCSSRKRFDLSAWLAVIESPSMDLCTLSATELVDLYRRKELSPVEVAAATQKRIEKLNPVLNAFNLISTEIASSAKASEARWMRGEPKGLLDGV